MMDDIAVISTAFVSINLLHKKQHICKPTQALQLPTISVKLSLISLGNSPGGEVARLVWGFRTDIAKVCGIAPRES
jgi:hypothetical protein